MNRANRCCRVWHERHDSRVGFPIEPDTYDWRMAVHSNALISVLFNRLMADIRKSFGRDVARFSVIEIQARGSRHYHALQRFPEEVFDLDKLREVVEKPRTCSTWEGDLVEFGRNVDLKVLSEAELLGRGTGDSERDRNPLGYMTKLAGYFFKGVNAVTMEPSRMSITLHRYAKTEFKCHVECEPKTCAERVHERPVDPRELFGKSRNWSLTDLTIGRQKRAAQDWMAARAAEGGLEDDDEMIGEEEVRARFLHSRWWYYTTLENQRQVIVKAQEKREDRRNGIMRDVWGEAI